MRRLAGAGYRFFMYAPKADAFLRRRWRETPPEAETRALAAFAATVIAGTLQKAGLITYHRGRVHILNREQLAGLLARRCQQDHVAGAGEGLLQDVGLAAPTRPAVHPDEQGDGGLGEKIGGVAGVTRSTQRA